MVDTKKDLFFKAAVNLADARIQFAEAFILYRSTGGDKMTDRQAEALATIKTQDKVTVAQANLEIARRNLDSESTKPKA